jgi:hypothetical protein
MALCAAHVPRTGFAGPPPSLRYAERHGLASNRRTGTQPLSHLSAKEVIGERGDRCSEVKEEAALAAGGHERNRSPRSPMTGATGDPSLRKENPGNAS